MLKVTVDLIPGGYLARTRTIRELTITNVTRTYGEGPQNYKVEAFGHWVGTIREWDQSRPVEDLVCEALKVLKDRPLKDY